MADADNPILSILISFLSRILCVAITWNILYSGFNVSALSNRESSNWYVIMHYDNFTYVFIILSG